jgi:hypothetical protein
MNSSAFALLACLGAAWAQTTPPAAESQNDRVRRMAAEGVKSAQTAPAAGATLPNLPDDAVIAVFEDGASLTMGDFRKITSILPAQSLQMALANPRATLQWWAGMRNLARLGEAQKLDQVSPTKEQLDYNRVMILGQATMNSKLNTLEVGSDDIDKYYQANKEQYKQVRVKALYVAFGDSATGKQSRTEAQAAADAAALLVQIRAGADFVKLVRERSDDQTSREKDGDFATFHRKDNIPDALSAAVFALKQGDVSEPIRQPNGYYLLRAEEVGYVPESQVQNDIVLTVREQRYNEWLQQNTAGVKVQFPNPAFPAAK